MITYKIKGKSGDIRFEEDAEWEILSLDPYIANSLANIAEKDDSDFAFFFDGDFRDELISGYMTFEAKGKDIITVTTYKAKRFLTLEEQEELMDYTQGQWADGVGEGYEQIPCCIVDSVEIYLSPWYKGQTITIEEIL